MRRVTPNALAISPVENSLSSRFIKNLGVKKSPPAVYRCMVYGFMIQKMRKNARKKFDCRGKLPRFSPLAPEAAVREKARSKPLKYSLLRSNKNYAQGGCPAHSLQLRVQKPLTALQNDTVACQGSFCRTRWPPRGSSRCRPYSGYSPAPRRASRFAGRCC